MWEIMQQKIAKIEEAFFDLPSSLISVQKNQIKIFDQKCKESDRPEEILNEVHAFHKKISDWHMRYTKLQRLKLYLHYWKKAHLFSRGYKELPKKFPDEILEFLSKKEKTPAELERTLHILEEIHAFLIKTIPESEL